MEKISAVYQIINTVTGDRYVGSSKNVLKRWESHKCPSSWEERPNSLLYMAMQKYGLENFRFQILAPVMPEYLKQVEQEFIEMLQPTYNKYNAKGKNSEKLKETYRKYKQSDKGKEVNRKHCKKYNSQPCFYNGEKLALNTLVHRFQRAGFENPTLEAKKYLLNK